MPTFDSLAHISNAKYIYLVEIVLDSGTIGFAKKDFTPIGTTMRYSGRLISAFDIGTSRSPLVWGKLSYSGGSITLNNADGYYDATAKNDWFVGYYGKKVRIKIGYENINISDYITIWTGYISKITLTQENVVFDVSETNKNLDEVDIQHSWININAMTVIKEAIILAYPEITYDSTYFDITSWNAAASLGILVSVDMTATKKALEVIEDVCSSIFGLFYMTADDKYSFVVVNPSATSYTTIKSCDILDVPSIEYDTSDVVSSVKVYCDISQDLKTGKYATTVEITSRKSYVYTRYGFYNSKEIVTYLPNATAAAAFADKYTRYTCDVHGIFTITTPMKYYNIVVGKTVLVELNREGGKSYLGTTKCEIIGKKYILDKGTIEFTMRICYDGT